MKRVTKIKSVLFDHGAVFYGIAAVLAVTAVIIYAGTHVSHASTVKVYDLTGAKRSNSTEIKVEQVFWGAMPRDSKGELLYDSIQGLAATDNYLVAILTPKGGNYDNSAKNLLKIIDPNQVDSKGMFKDVSANFNNPKAGLHHANGATYNPKTKQIVVASTAPGTPDGGTIHIVNGQNFSYLGSTFLRDAKGEKVYMSSVAYDIEHDRYYNAFGKYIYSITNNYIAKGFVEINHLLVNQDVEYSNGYIYRGLWEANGKWKGHEQYNGLYETNDGVIFQFAANGDHIGNYYMSAPSCELESIAFYKDVPYVLFNHCKDMKANYGGYYMLARVKSEYIKDFTHQYKIKYDENGGEWSGAAPAADTAYVGVNKNITTKTPTRQYYTFKGWATSKTATTAKYSAGSKYLINYGGQNKDVTLYAVWEEQTYKVTYNNNGGTGAPSAVTKGKTQNVALSNGASMQREHYTFIGWSTTKSAKTAEYAPGATYTGRANLTLYAVWKAKTYIVKYDARGGTGAPSSETVEEIYNITISDTHPTWSFHNFVGWATDPNSTTVAYYGTGDEVYAEHKNLTLYALWSVDNYTLSFNANGGAGAPTSITKPKTVGSLTLPKTKPTRAGYNFLGWSTSSTATTASYQPGGSFANNTAGRGNVTLYAVWEQQGGGGESLPTFILSFDPNGGEGGPEEIAVNRPEEVTIPSDKPVRDGYSFLGWATTRTAASAQYHAGGSYSLSDNTTLYALWQVSTIKLTYKANGGVGAPSAHQGRIGEINVSTTVPTRAGYTFDGWSVEANDNVAYQPGDKFRGTTSTTLTAVWSENTITIRYHMRGGSNGPVNHKGAPKHEVKLSSARPTRKNYEFLGWSLSEDGNSVDYVPGEEIGLKMADVDLYAVWDSDWYTVSFDGNGAEDEPPMPLMERGDDVIIPNDILHQYAHGFLGWSRDMNATEAEYVGGDTYSEATSVVLYAVWEEVDTGEDDIDPGTDADERDDYEPSEDADGESVKPENPKTESFDISGLLPILSATFVGIGVIFSYARRR